jgi:hypothetical protein
VDRAHYQHQLLPQLTVKFKKIKKVDRTLYQHPNLFWQNKTKLCRSTFGSFLHVLKRVTVVTLVRFAQFR